MINNYFIKREQIIANFDIVVMQQIEKKKIDDNFGILKGSLFFENGRLEFIEVVKIISKKAIKIKYKYHYMANDNTMIFRYDNVKHHHNISTFPHHKHIPSKIVPSEEPDLVIILSEINNMLINF